MAKPPATPPVSPPSSDIDGADRDAHASRARGKPAEPGQQQKLAQAAEETVARPDYEDDVDGRENAR